MRMNNCKINYGLDISANEIPHRIQCITINDYNNDIKF